MYAGRAAVRALRVGPARATAAMTTKAARPAMGKQASETGSASDTTSGLPDITRRAGGTKAKAKAKARPRSKKAAAEDARQTSLLATFGHGGPAMAAAAAAASSTRARPKPKPRRSTALLTPQTAISRVQSLAIALLYPETGRDAIGGGAVAKDGKRSDGDDDEDYDSGIGRTPNFRTSGWSEANAIRSFDMLHADLKDSGRRLWRASAASAATKSGSFVSGAIKHAQARSKVEEVDEDEEVKRFVEVAEDMYETTRRDIETLQTLYRTWIEAYVRDFSETLAAREDAAASGAESEADLSKMTLREMKAFAQAHGIEYADHRGLVQGLTAFFAQAKPSRALNGPFTQAAREVGVEISSDDERPAAHSGAAAVPGRSGRAQRQATPASERASIDDEDDDGIASIADGGEERCLQILSSSPSSSASSDGGAAAASAPEPVNRRRLRALAPAEFGDFCLKLLKATDERWLQVLRYEPLDFHTLLNEVESAGYKCPKKDLQHFLDSKGVNFSLPNERTRRRKSPTRAGPAAAAKPKARKAQKRTGSASAAAESNLSDSGSE